MIIIQSLSDINALYESSFPSPIVSYATQLFIGLCNEANQDEQADHLLHNPIFLCEQGDDLLRRFSEAPLGIEFVELVDLSSLLIYRVGIMLDNDSVSQYLVPINTLDESTICWLSEHTESGGVNNE